MRLAVRSSRTLRRMLQKRIAHLPPTHTMASVANIRDAPLRSSIGGRLYILFVPPLTGDPRSLSPLRTDLLLSSYSGYDCQQERRRIDMGYGS